MMGQNVIVPNIGEGRREGEEKQHSLVGTEGKGTVGTRGRRRNLLWTMNCTVVLILYVAHWGLLPIRIGTWYLSFFT